MNTEYSMLLMLLLVLFITYWIMPSLVANTLPFGVRIPPQRQDEPVIAHTRRTYRIMLTLVTVLFAVAGWFLLQVVQIWVPILLPLVMLIPYGLIYYTAHQRIATVKAHEQWYAGLHQAVIADTEPESQEASFPMFWLIPPVGLLAAMIVIGILRYPALPDRIPSHFDMNGNPNGWTNKTFDLFFTPLLSLALTALFVALAAVLLRLRGRIDPADPEGSRQRIRRSYQIFTRMFLGLAAITNGIMLLVSLLVWQVLAPATATPLIVIIAILLPLFAVVIPLVLFARQQTTRPLVNAGGGTGYVFRDDDRYWKGGMLYVNRDDPSLMVEKRFGIGWTLNFGHPLAIWLSIGFIAIMALLVVLPFVLGR